MSEQAVCGLTTAQRPVTTRWLGNQKVELLYKGERIGVSTNVSPEGVQSIEDLANEMFQAGFQACGSELMPQLMKGDA